MTRLVVKEIVAGFVAEITDFPVHNMDEQVAIDLRNAWTKYPVLRFRNVPIGDAEQIAITKALGPIFLTTNVQHGKREDSPEIFVIANKKNPDGTPAGDLGDGEVQWHTDHWWIKQPPSAALLRALEVPPAGGNTYWANMYSAYAALPDSMKARLRGLYIHHQDVLDISGAPRRGKEMPASKDFAAWSGVDHPIVMRHPASGKPCLYLGAGRERQVIVGMRQDEASELLDQLWQCATSPDHVWHQEWRPGDMIIWDNRCLLHRRDQFDPRSVRLMHRTTAQGQRPVAAA
ncbi:(R)-phenoxypropionate/alpha-ketoglutarate-dioxygenase [Bradyrhizobium ivorense]|uniref:(R)-phenoxypropionate/alpha-ketoglutarate-dioxygenase n=1 Tax=Bradyrhizobium ivorense TaxID=2511166 RepID=A0A508T3W0_9BRAD|nr:TauD/TfdA family dioxygenase [Bradyrhizobium ivorense]VIO70075.1 (R)-phenoxypropionate/alpha-ketoglutarate-dioxygenase [Bradyrhizobium ivorense]